MEEGGRIVGAALRTPPHNVVLSELDDVGAAAALARDMREACHELPGVLGPVDGARAFVRSWEPLAGARGRLALSERIYQADSVTPPERSEGRMRPYAPADRVIALEWLAAFAAEAMPDGLVPGGVEEVLDRRLADPDGGFALWETDRPVSLAGFGGATPNGIRIGPVYTPPDLRGHGYASGLAAGLTQQLLAGGRRFCFLFTDLANPTSNSIYQRVGYRPVVDVSQWAF